MYSWASWGHPENLSRLAKLPSHMFKLLGVIHVTVEKARGDAVVSGQLLMHLIYICSSHCGVITPD